MFEDPSPQSEAAGLIHRSANPGLLRKQCLYPTPGSRLNVVGVVIEGTHLRPRGIPRINARAFVLQTEIIDAWVHEKRVGTDFACTRRWGPSIDPPASPTVLQVVVYNISPAVVV
jgi:hypothetical protein